MCSRHRVGVDLVGVYKSYGLFGYTFGRATSRTSLGGLDDRRLLETQNPLFDAENSESKTVKV